MKHGHSIQGGASMEKHSRDGGCQGIKGSAKMTPHKGQSTATPSKTDTMGLSGGTSMATKRESWPDIKVGGVDDPQQKNVGTM